MSSDELDGFIFDEQLLFLSPGGMSDASIASLVDTPNPIIMSSTSLNRGETSDFLGKLFVDDDSDDDYNMELDVNDKQPVIGSVTGGKVQSDLKSKMMIPIQLKSDGIWSASLEDGENAKKTYMTENSSTVPPTSKQKLKIKSKKKKKKKKKKSGGGRKRKTRCKKKSKRKKRRKSKRRKTNKKKI